jgi:hypothetical protein
MYRIRSNVTLRNEENPAMNGTLGGFAGLNVIESPLLPLDPSPGAVGRRIVRHGMADVLAWLGEDVGPKPDAQTHVLLFDNTNLVASAAIVGAIRAEVSR